jgi:hypothetical protein
LTLAHQQMSNDHEKLKQEEAEKSSRLQDLMYVKSRKSTNSKLTNEIINAKLATPLKKKSSNNNNNNSKFSNRRWDDEKSIEHICDYYDELQYNYEYFNNDDNSHSDNKCENQVYQLTKKRKDILNRKLIGYRERLKCEKLLLKGTVDEKSLISSISSLVDTMTIPTFHFHLILSLTMMLLTHQCPQYLLVL